MGLPFEGSEESGRRRGEGMIEPCERMQDACRKPDSRKSREDTL